MTVNEEIGEMLKSLTEPKGEKDGSDSSTKQQEIVHKESDNSGNVSSGSDVAEDRGSDRSPEPKGTGQEADKAPDKAASEAGVDANTNPVETKEEPKVDDKDKIIEELRAKLAEKETTKPPESKVELKVEPPTEQDFLGEQDFDELTRDPKQLNAILNKVYQKAATDTRESMMKDLPNVIRENVAVIENLRETSTKFYEENPDLAGFKKVVATVFEEVAAKDPNRSIADIVKDVASETRKRLDLTKKVDDKANGKEKKEPPKLPTKGSKAGSPQTKSTVNPLQAELEDMNKVIRR